MSVPNTTPYSMSVLFNLTRGSMCLTEWLILLTDLGCSPSCLNYITTNHESNSNCGTFPAPGICKGIFLLPRPVYWMHLPHLNVVAKQTKPYPSHCPQKAREKSCDDAACPWQTWWRWSCDSGTDQRDAVGEWTSGVSSADDVNAEIGSAVYHIDRRGTTDTPSTPSMAPYEMDPLRRDITGMALSVSCVVPRVASQLCPPFIHRFTARSHRGH